MKKNVMLLIDSIKILGGAEKVAMDIMDLFNKNINYNMFLYSKNNESIGYLDHLKSVFNVFDYFRIKKYIKLNNIDIIHIHKLMSVTILFAIPKGKKIVMTVHDYKFCCPKLGVTKNNEQCKGGLFHFNCNRPIERNFILNIIFDFAKWTKFVINRYFVKKYVDVFLCPSRSLHDYLINSLKIPLEKVVYLPNFIEIEEGYNPNFTKIEDNRFLYVGRLSNEKGIDVAIKAIDLLVKKENITDIYFDIIGAGPDKSSLENLVLELGLQNNIKFLGKIDNSSLSEYYEKSNGLLMPSVWLENNPLVAIEGMKYGKTIIACNVGGYGDLVEEGKNGYLFPIGNHIELANKIKNLYKNKDLSVEMGKYGFEKLKKEFNSELFYEKLLGFYS